MIEILAGYIAVVLLIIVVLVAVSIFNRLISLKNNVDKAWANIEVLLKQRSDLVPNLVATVKGYAKYEQSLLKKITELRTSIVSGANIKELAKNSDALSSSLKTVFSIAESYPTLQASNNFVELQKELTEIEDMIADRREFYNDSVLLFNTHIHSFPDMFLAGTLKMTDMEYFKATEDEKKLVSVNAQIN